VSDSGWTGEGVQAPGRLYGFQAAPITPPTTARYDAFISYSHAADERLAASLQAGLSQFAKPWHRLRGTRVFRDTTNLSVYPDLWGAIETALRESNYFILLACPNSAHSKWVRREIETWLSQPGAADRLLIVVTAGHVHWDDEKADLDWTRTDALPNLLSGRFAREPLHLALNWASPREQLSSKEPRFQDAIASLAATIQGRDKDELIGEDVRQHRRVRHLVRIVIAALSLLVLGLAVAAAAALRYAARANESSAEVVHAARASAAKEAFRDGYLQRALLLSLSDVEPGSKLDPTTLQLLRDVLPQLPEATVLAAPVDSLVALGSSHPPGIVVSGLEDGRVQFWSTDGRQIESSRGHAGPVQALAFAPDWSSVASGGKDGTARIWDRAGRATAGPWGRGAAVTVLAFTADGENLLTGTQQGDIWKWSIRSSQGTLLATNHEAVQSIAVIGANILALWLDGTARMISADGRLIRELSSGGPQAESGPCGPQRITGLAPSPDGEVVCGACTSGVGFIQSLAPRGEVMRLTGHADDLDDVTFSPDGKLCATSSFDGTTRLWHRDGRLAVELRGSSAAIKAAAFSPNGRAVVTASADGAARIWTTEGKLLGSFRGHEGEVTQAAFVDDERVLTRGADGTVQVWTARRPQRGVFAGHDAGLYWGTFSHSGKRVVTAAEDKSARLWDLEGRELARLEGHKGIVTWASFSADDDCVVTASDDREARVWCDLEPRVERASVRLGPHRDGLVYAEFLPANRRVITASQDGKFAIWDASSGHLVSQKDVGGRLAAARLSADGSRVVVGLDDGTIQVWLLDGSPRERIGVSIGGRFSSLAWSPDDRAVVSTARDGKVRLWTIGDKETRVVTTERKEAWDAEFSPDGTLLAIASDASTARIVDLDGREVAKLVGHDSTVSSAVFSPDGEHVLTASTDHTARIWPLTAAEVLRQAKSSVNRGFTTEERSLYGALLPPARSR